MNIILDLESIDRLELNIEIAKEFGIDLEEGFWTKVKTFADLVDEVARQVETKSDPLSETTKVPFPDVFPELLDTLKEIEPLLEGRELDEKTDPIRLAPVWRRGRLWERLRKRYPMLATIQSGAEQNMLKWFLIEPFFFFGFLISFLLARSLTNPFLSWFFTILAVVGFVGFIALFPIILLGFFRLPYRNLGQMARVIAIARNRLYELKRGDKTPFEIPLKTLLGRVLAEKPEEITLETSLRVK